MVGFGGTGIMNL